jgi:hypothetical protein
MIGIWEQIIQEGKKESLFYDGSVKDLKEWIDYIYCPANHVALVIDNEGEIYHIAWINKFSNKNGFLHHCGLGKYNRQSWPVLKKFWSDMRDINNKPVIHTLLGVTPESNTKAIKLTKMLGWTIMGKIPGICYISHNNRYEPGWISYIVINEV